MKVLCMSYEYPPIGGGGGVICRGLAESLAHLGYEMDIVTSSMKNLPAYEEVEGVRIHRVKCLRRFSHYVCTSELLTELLPSYCKAVQLARKNDYVFNHTHFVLPSGIISYFLWKKLALPYIITAHGSDIPSFNPDRFHLEHWILKPLWKRILKNSTAVTSPSHFLKRLIHKHLDVPVTVIPNGHTFSNAGEIPPRQDRILSVTRMFERKGIQYLLSAVRDLKASWEILVAGDGPYLSSLKSMARRMGAPVKFLGFVGGETLHELYRSAKIFVFPSVQENFPVVLLEAMNAGCAVVTTNADGCAEVVGDAGIKTDTQNVTQIREALDLLISDPSEIEKLSCLARQRAGEFAWPIIAQRYDDLFHHSLYKLGRVDELQRLRERKRKPSPPASDALPFDAAYLPRKSTLVP